MATHSSILAWNIPWTEEPDALQSMRSQRGSMHVRYIKTVVFKLSCMLESPGSFE